MPKVAVCGPKGVGKTTFCRFLVNSLLNYHPVVAFLEADVGQCEFTPPGLGTYKATRVLMSCLEGTRYAQGNCTRQLQPQITAHQHALQHAFVPSVGLCLVSLCVVVCCRVVSLCVCVCVCVLLHVL